MITISSAEHFHAAVAATTETSLVACFSAPWSGGSKLVVPKVEKLAEELEGTASFVNVSAEDLETLCEEVEVDNFPHFRVYKAGKILGDFSSSKFDKVNAFIRGLVAPETVKETEETPEGDAATEETAEKENESTEAAGPKKRQERDEVEDHDEQITKKAKTEETVSKDEEVAGEKDDETAEEASREVETAQEEQHTVAEDNAVPAEQIAKEADVCTVDATAA